MNTYLILITTLLSLSMADKGLEMRSESRFYEPYDAWETISHQTWNELLNAHVSPSGAVDYKGFQQDATKLDQYLTFLSENPPQQSWSDNEQLAYWINAYNAFTVKLILDNYPLKSIMDLNEPWDTPFITIGGKKYTLNDIEHQVIRKQFDEPRIHFAVNCASQSCPELLNKAYTADQLDSQLEAQTRAYINNTKHNEISADHVSISSLFDWYKEDFTKSGTVIDFLNTYAEESISSNAKISYKKYDWSLNE